jgi:Holliday junction DNA helicase RuvB
MTLEEINERYGARIGPATIQYNWSRVQWAKEASRASEPAPEVDFLGQPAVVNQLEPWLTRERPFPHVLIKGEPGLGKTQLGRWIAYQREEPFTELMCPVKPEQIPTHGIVLLDEAHRITKPEWLYPAMEDGVPTFIAATTRPDKLDAPFRSRFFIQVQLERYDQDSMLQIVRSLAPEATDEEIAILAKASAGSPRQAHRLVETAEGLGTYDSEAVLAASRITADGLTDDHIRYLIALKSTGRPTGVGQVAVLLYADEDGVKQLERFLLNRGLIALHNSGRVLTHQGALYLKEIMGG